LHACSQVHLPRCFPHALVPQRRIHLAECRASIPAKSEC
jgi:hypothetical protein